MSSSSAERETIESQLAKLKLEVTKCKDKRTKATLTGEIALLEDRLDNLVDESAKTNDTAGDTVQTGTANNKVSKARRKREDKAKADAERQRAIEIETEEASRTSSRRVERDQLTSLLAERGLRLFEIEPNGDCLYSSVIHQFNQKRAWLTQIDVRLRGDTHSTENAEEFALSVKTLRQACASYMLEHADDFMPFVETDDGEPCDENRFKDYCDRIVNEPVWATHLEIGALSHLLRRAIRVIQCESPNEIVIGEEYEKDDIQSFFITFERHAYTLGEHFNSTEVF